MLSFSDLSIGHIVFETRYDLAFLIFDRTGAICQASQKHYPELTIVQASPSITTFTAKEHAFSVDQVASRAQYGHSNIDAKEFASSAAPFFRIVIETLEIPILTRIGLRIAYYAAFPEADEASDFIRSLKFQHDVSEVRFGISNKPNEVIFRWESSDLGAMVHVTSQPGNTALPFGDMAKAKEGFGKTYKSLVVFDVDYYTLKPAHRKQLDPEEWITQSSHLIKKEIRSLISQWQTPPQQ